jgi:hypothetical protein
MNGIPSPFGSTPAFFLRESLLFLLSFTVGMTSVAVKLTVGLKHVAKNATLLNGIIQSNVSVFVLQRKPRLGIIPLC